MSAVLDGERLFRLLSDFSAMTGIRMAVVDRDGRSICSGGLPARFCTLVASCGGDARCAACAEREAGEDVCTFRCHAGVRTAVFPIRFGAQAAPLAWLRCGPFLDDAPMEEQWMRTRDALDWFTGDVAALRSAFLGLRRLDRDQQAACVGMLDALADCLLHRDWIGAAGETDLQRLDRFLDEHYMEKLTLTSISAQLHIGRTRLCALAKELSGGRTLLAMISERRIDRAKALLAQSDSPVSAVAEAVGISDYNYFSKVFRAAVGVTPSEFRRRAREKSGRTDR